MGKGRYIGSVPQQLTSGDKDFIKRIEAGQKKAPAFRASYPEHRQVIIWQQSEPGSPDHKKAMELIVAAAKNKLQAKYMRGAIVTYQDSMERFSELSVETAIDLVENARSEKVRADLAIEGIRHKVGSPTVKVQVQENKLVILQFGDPPKDAASILEGETVDDQ